MHLKDYFERIGFRGSACADYSTLAALQQSHSLAVPFENLDVQLGRPLTTDVEQAYCKIVENGRGGWCYEQNGLFGWVLSHIGFEVTRVAGAVMRQAHGHISAANHLCLLVRCPGTSAQYLVDVGFGGSLFTPIEVTESAHSQPPFRLGLTKLPDGHWRFWEDLGNGEFTFDFLCEPASETVLAAKCDFLQTDPSSSFVRTLVAQLRSRDGHRTLRGRVLSIATPDGVTTRTLDSASEMAAVLDELFGLKVPEIAGLWPRIAARHREYLQKRADDSARVDEL